MWSRPINGTIKTAPSAKEADGWYMVVGSRIENVGGAVFLYRSTNLTDWEYLHPLLISKVGPGTGIWECPNFFKLGDEWVLILPDPDGPFFHIIAEGSSDEQARVLVEKYAGLVTGLQ